MEGSGRCSAAFCESAALRESFCLAQAGGTLSVFASQIHLPRKGEVLLYLPEGAEKLPLRGICRRRRLGEFAPFFAHFAQKGGKYFSHPA